METYLLAEGLLAVGLGGSVPAYYTHYDVYEGEDHHYDDDSHVEEKYETLDSYPYASEDDLRADLDKLWFDKVVP